MRKQLFATENLLYWLLVFVPIAIFLEIRHASKTWIFVTSCLAILPLAGLMGKATEHLASKVGEGLGGLLNATFGNAAELIIATMMLKEGLHEVVKASITGSIIGNVFLVLGLSVLAGGLKFKQQTFNRTAASLGATLLALSGIALVVPALFHFINQGSLNSKVMVQSEQDLSLEIAVVLFVTYVLSLVFALRTHRHLYEGAAEEEHHELWSTKKSIAVLFVSTVFVGLMSEFLVGAIEQTGKELNLSDVFIGVIVVAIIGNAAEHSTAILMALKNKMDLSLNIAVGSSLQIALFVAPVLVFASYAFGKPMNLIFSPFEVLAVVLCVLVLNMIASDGESNWMEGVQMLAVYTILGIAFYFLP
ncbi:MAG: calcium/proton exchanger [Acidobacteriota bacterium]|nr:calcium/proton exchanger [Blastocatellia bacterium]MDW8413310.1 calcium/proton exchanger [Acidobacteriota bacterium]